MTLNGFLQTYHADCVSTLGAALWRPRGGSIDRAGIHTVDLHFVMLLTCGWMTVRMDNREVTLTANCYVDTASCHDCTVITEASPDVDGYMLVTTEKFLSHVFKSRMPFLPECFEYVLRCPVSLFDGRTAAIVAEAFASMERSIYDCANVHNDELVATKTAVLFYEISNCLLRRTAFDDQAVFTKFFKRQTGMMPMQYRKCGLEGQALGQRV